MSLSLLYIFMKIVFKEIILFYIFYMLFIFYILKEILKNIGYNLKQNVHFDYRKDALHLELLTFVYNN